MSLDANRSTRAQDQTLDYSLTSVKVEVGQLFAGLWKPKVRTNDHRFCSSVRTFGQNECRALHDMDGEVLGLVPCYDDMHISSLAAANALH
jgi:hypothetical protein